MEKFLKSPMFFWVVGGLVIFGYLIKMGSKGVRTDHYPDMSKDQLGEGAPVTPYISMAKSVRPNPVYPTGPMMISRN